MSCVLYMYGEKRINNSWTSIHPLILNPNYDEIGNEHWTKQHILEWVKCNENYALFTLLAGVKSFANKNIKAISKPKGLPDNISVEVKSEMITGKIEGYHSHSYFTLEELLSVQKQFPTYALISLLTKKNNPYDNIENELQLIINQLPTDLDTKAVRIIFCFEN